MASPSPAAPRKSRQLSLFDCVCIIVGIIIGAGIFESAPIIAANVVGVADGALEQVMGDDEPTAAQRQTARITVLALVWLVGGCVALVGALCYAELGSAYRDDGGDYVYLKHAYGRSFGYLFIWAEFWVIRPANIGAMAFVFANYFGQITPFVESIPLQILYACLAIVSLTLMNLIGIRGGPVTQNVLTVAKVTGMLVVVAAAFILPASDQPRDPRPLLGDSASLALAAVFVLYTFGGWNDVVFVTNEIRDPKRNLVRALFWGTMIVTSIYVLINLAFAVGLGYERAATSSHVAAELMRDRAGVWGARFISALVCVSALGSINGMTFTGARIYYTLGKEHRAFRWLGVWVDRFGGPLRAILVQVAFTLVLVITFGRNERGFERLVISGTPVFWSFFFLVGMSLLVLRDRDGDRERPYRVPGYPVTPLVFCLSSLYVLNSSVSYAMANLRLWEWLWPLGMLAIGVLLFASRGRRPNGAEPEKFAD